MADISETKGAFGADVADMNVKLGIFEGPLDLLLFLIRKNEIDIYDIPIEQITSQYIAALKTMESLSLEIAGEFFVMAATLMYIKSRMLLPVDERVEQAAGDDEEDIDPRWELVEQLLEYKKIKQGAGLLSDLIDRRQNYLDRYCVGKEEESERPLKPADRMEIWNTFNNVLRRLSEKLVHGKIEADNVTVADRMEFLISYPKSEFTFSELFESLPFNPRAIVATFLAMLELTRLRRMRLEQSAAFDEIYCTKFDEPLKEEAPLYDVSSIEWEGDSVQKPRRRKSADGAEVPGGDEEDLPMDTDGDEPDSGVVEDGFGSFEETQKTEYGNVSEGEGSDISSSGNEVGNMALGEGDTSEDRQ